jgi:hypothetical protein
MPFLTIISTRTDSDYIKFVSYNLKVYIVTICIIIMIENNCNVEFVGMYIMGTSVMTLCCSLVGGYHHFG